METAIPEAERHRESPVPLTTGIVRARRVLSLAPSTVGDTVGWRDGRIVAVGRARDVVRRMPTGTPLYELPDAIVTPGFVDGHTHFAMWALGRRQVQLAGARTRDEAVARVAAAVPVQGWVVGHGWDANLWDDVPDRTALDRVQAAPVYLDSLDVHAAWVNSAALTAAGISRATPDPFGGRIVRDAAGEPTGLLLERAVELMLRCLPESPAASLEAALLAAQAEAHRLGLTGIHEVGTLPTLRAFERLERANTLRLRVLFHPPVAALPELVRGGVRSGQGSGWLRVGGVKMFLDGSLGTRTAWMLDPYEGSRDRGMPITTEEVAAGAIREAAAAGIASTVHAIGDAAVRRALDLLSTAPRVGVPHRIEHFQCVHPDDLGRAAAAGIVVSMQPAHLLTDIPLVDRHWGARGRGAYAFESLRRLGTPMVFGSDVPVASIDPREGLFSAMARRDATAGAGSWRREEALAFTEAVRPYTAGAAHAAGLGPSAGTLAPGEAADLVAWDFDPVVESAAAGASTAMTGAAAGDAARAGRARLTVVAGEVVMQQ